MRGSTRFISSVLVVVGLLLPAVPAAAEPTAAQLDRRIAAAAQRLEVVVEQYNDVRVDLRETTARQHALDRELAPLETDVDERRVVLAGIAGNVYRQNVRGPSITLLGARSPDQFMDQLLSLHRFDAEQRRALADLDQARNRVEGTRRTLDALAARQRLHEARLAATKRTVEGEITALRQLRARAYGGGQRYADDPGDRPAPPYVPGAAGRAVAFAYAQLGKPYSWGASGPDAYDCSGLTSAAWATAGVDMPHNARRQYGSVAHVSRAALRPGDLVFYYGGISHVAIYVGDGKMIHAPEYGENVRIDDVDYQPIHGYGRPSG